MPAAAQEWTRIELGLPPGTNFAFPADVNNQLQVVGFAGVGPPYYGGRPFFWDPIAGYRVIDMTGVFSLQINNQGAVAGVRYITGRGYQAFLWANGVFTDLPATPRRSYATVTELTDSGIVMMRESYDVGDARDGGYRDWAIVQNTLYDLTDRTSLASITGISEQGTLSAGRDSRAYLFFADGRSWQAPWPNASIKVGPAGHFAGTFSEGSPGSYRISLFVGMPDLRMITMPLPGSPSVPFAGISAVNRRGDFVGGHTAQDGRSEIFLVRNNEIIYGVPLYQVNALTDTGWILGLAQACCTFVQPVLLSRSLQPPGSVSFSLAGRMVTVRWQASAGASDYILEAGSAAGASNLFNASVGSALSVSAVVPPGRYYVRLRARNDQTMSGPSQEIVIDVP